jgi:hypothetical protein
VFLKDRGDHQYPSKKRKFASICVSDDIKRKNRSHSNAKKKLLEPVGAEEVEVAKVPNNENIVVKQSPVMRKKCTQLSIRKQKMIRNAVKQRVEDHWAQISPLYPEELGRCLEDMNYITQKSSESDSLINAYKLAYEKNDEERKNALLSVLYYRKLLSSRLLL